MSRQMMVTASASKGKGKGKKHKVSHMVMRRAENGFSTETHPMPSADSPYPDPQTHVFPDAQGAAAHMMSTMGAEPDGDEAQQG